MAIFFADLSGYTALTETHGPVSAADLIDKFIEIAKDCLVGDTKLHQRTGDEIMVISESADSLLATALKLEANTLNEENFLQVHGGLHFGRVLERADHYYGSAMNLASRIASGAAAGNFCCSSDFVNAVTDKSVCGFESRGAHLFKNISKEMEVFELSMGNAKTKYIDPVCRMSILNYQNSIPHPIEGGVYFCSSHCLEIYKQQRWAAKAAQN